MKNSDTVVITAIEKLKRYLIITFLNGVKHISHRATLRAGQVK